MSEYADGFDDGKGEKFDELMEEIVILREKLKECHENGQRLLAVADSYKEELAALRLDAERYGRVKQFLQHGNGTLDARGTDSAAFDVLIDALPKEEGK